MEKNSEDISSCCKPTGKKPKSLMQGIVYGLIPHIGCIAFIIASVLGLTVFASLFRPLLVKSYFFYIMIAMSLVFASISAFFYLKKQGGLYTAKQHKGYLTILYGSTMLVSALLYLVIFPLVAASTNAENSITGNVILENLNALTLDVNIPCPGHAPLITKDLKAIEGVSKVEYSPFSTFKVYYNPEQTTKEKILSLEIFKEYKATVIEESNNMQNNLKTNVENQKHGSCCSGSSCGGSCCGGKR